MENQQPTPQPPRMFVISMGCFPFDCLVAINKTPKQVQRLLTKYGKPMEQTSMEYLEAKKDGSAAYVFNDTYNTSLIFIKSPRVNRTIALFDHEKMHLLNHVLGKIGIKLNNETEEVYAYVSEYLLKQFLNKF